MLLKKHTGARPDLTHHALSGIIIRNHGYLQLILRLHPQRQIWFAAPTTKKKRKEKRKFFSPEQSGARILRRRGIPYTRTPWNARDTLSETGNNRRERERLLKMVNLLPWVPSQLDDFCGIKKFRIVSNGRSAADRWDKEEGGEKKRGRVAQNHRRAEESENCDDGRMLLLQISNAFSFNREKIWRTKVMEDGEFVGIH